MNPLRSSFGAALLFLLSGCVTTQDGPTFSAATGELSEPGDAKLGATIKPGVRPALETDEAGLRMMYDKAETTFKTSGSVIRDPQINRILKAFYRIFGQHCSSTSVTDDIHDLLPPIEWPKSL